MTDGPSGNDPPGRDGHRSSLPGGRALATFMDIHPGFAGVTRQQLQEAHERDLENERAEGVHFERAWLDPVSGRLFCLSTGPSRESVIRVHERSGHPTADVFEVAIEVS